MNSGENNIEWLNDQEKVCASFSQRKWITKMKKLYEKSAGEMDLYENADGSILVHFPLKWVKVSKTREVSKEQREKARENFVKYLKNVDNK